MFKIKEDEYKNWIDEFKDDSPAYHAAHLEEGLAIRGHQFNDNDAKYPTIENDKLIKASEKFVGRLQEFKGPLRKLDEKNKDNRIEAAQAFNSYLLNSIKFGKDAAAVKQIFINKKSEDSVLGELLRRSYWKKNLGLDSNHILAICLMLCLYGHQKQG